MNAASEGPYRIRPGEPGDAGFLRDMLYEAVYRESDRPEPTCEEVLSRPGISRYLEGWGRPADAAVVALGDGRRVGAAWYRLMRPEDPGYGFVDAATPELAIAVVPEHRGRGAGGKLLRSLKSVAASQGFRALSLSVRNRNPAIQLYERHGFRKLFETGDSWTMRAGLFSGGGEAAPNYSLAVTTLDERLAVCRLDASADVPDRAVASPLFSVTRTADELSVVCPEERVPPGAECEKGWRAFKLEGPFEFSAIGVLAAISAPLAEAGVSIFAVSTFDTDYVLVKEDQLDLATATLRERGHVLS